MRSRFLAGIEELGHRWGWYFALGTLLIILGVIATSFAFLTTVASVIVFGWVLVFAGIALGVQAFMMGRWSGFLLSAAAATLSVITGFMLLRAPLAGAAVVTLLVASFLLISGIFRAVSAIAMQFPNWGWSLASGIVTFALGGLLASGWPQTSLWFLGLYVGIDLIVHGFAWCMFAISVHRIARDIDLESGERRVA